MVILKNADYADTTNYGYDADAHIVHIFLGLRLVGLGLAGLVLGLGLG